MHLSARGFLSALTLALAIASPVAAKMSRQTLKEAEVKATFLFNFAQFVTWPPQAAPEPGAPLVIGILGHDPFGAALENILRGASVGQRPLVVRRYRRVEDAAAANILFINLPDARSTSAAIAALRARPVLTVSDTEGFCQNGGMIRFLEDRRHIRFQINPTAVRASGLAISSRLLQVADIVETPPGR